MLAAVKATMNVLEALYSSHHGVMNILRSTLTEREYSLLDSPELRQSPAKLILDVSDSYAAKVLFGKDANVDARYRKAITRLQTKLEHHIVPPVPNSALLKSQIAGVNTIRDFYLAYMHSRVNDTRSSSNHFRQVIRGCRTPELICIAGPALFTLALNEAKDFNYIATQKYITEVNNLAKDISTTTYLDGAWMMLVSYGNTTNKRTRMRSRLSLEARTWLLEHPARSLSPVVRLSAARLAIAVSQALVDTTLGLAWCEVYRRTATELKVDPEVVKRDYHTNRLYIFTASEDPLSAIREANAIQKSSPIGTVPWFYTSEALAAALLNGGKFERAYTTLTNIVSHKNYKRQPAILHQKVAVRMMYATLLTGRKDPRNRFENAIKDSTQKRYDVHRRIQIILTALDRRLDDEILTLADQFRRFTVVSSWARKDRALGLLAKLILRLAKADFDIDAFRKSRITLKMEQELLQKVPTVDSIAIVPWKFIWQHILNMKKTKSR